MTANRNTNHDWDGPLTGRQLFTIIIVIAVLVGGFFGGRAMIRKDAYARCLASEPTGANYCVEHR